MSPPHRITRVPLGVTLYRYVKCIIDRMIGFYCKPGDREVVLLRMRIEKLWHCTAVCAACAACADPCNLCSLCSLCSLCLTQEAPLCTSIDIPDYSIMQSWFRSSLQLTGRLVLVAHEVTCRSMMWCCCYVCTAESNVWLCLARRLTGWLCSQTSGVEGSCNYGEATLAAAAAAAAADAAAAAAPLKTCVETCVDEISRVSRANLNPRVSRPNPGVSRANPNPLLLLWCPRMFWRIDLLQSILSWRTTILHTVMDNAALHTHNIYGYIQI